MWYLDNETKTKIRWGWLLFGIFQHFINNTKAVNLQFKFLGFACLYKSAICYKNQKKIFLVCPKIGLLNTLLNCFYQIIEIYWFWAEITAKWSFERFKYTLQCLKHKFPLHLLLLKMGSLLKLNLKQFYIGRNKSWNYS